MLTVKSVVQLYWIIVQATEIGVFPPKTYHLIKTREWRQTHTIYIIESFLLQ